jgi:hypothetical protein
MTEWVCKQCEGCFCTFHIKGRKDIELSECPVTGCDIKPEWWKKVRA